MTNKFYDLNDISKNWILSKLKHIFELSNETSTEYKSQKNLALTKKGIIEKDIELNEGQIARDYKKYIYIKKNQICMNPMDLLSGWVDISPTDGLISPAYYTLIPKENFDVKFLNYFLQSNYYRKTFFSIGKGVASHDNYGRWLLTPGEFKNISIYYPKLEEQKTISNYLEKETKNIDQLVEKIHKKIELLKEQRVSLIDHYISKGLDTNIEMKDSGVEWIGKIPKHWSLTKIRFITDDHRQGFYTSDPYDDDGIPILRITDIRDDHSFSYSDSPKYSRSENEIKNFYVKSGDFLFPRTGGVGQFGIIDFDFPCIYGSFMIRFRFSKAMNKDFIKFFFISSYFVNQVKQQIHGGVNQNVHVENIKNVLLFKPSINDQTRIAEYVSKNIHQLDTYIKLEQKRITLLEEYKQSLISFVVIGKVRITEDLI